MASVLFRPPEAISGVVLEARAITTGDVRRIHRQEVVACPGDSFLFYDATSVPESAASGEQETTRPVVGLIVDLPGFGASCLVNWLKQTALDALSGRRQ